MELDIPEGFVIETEGGESDIPPGFEIEIEGQGAGIDQRVNQTFEAASDPAVQRPNLGAAMATEVNGLPITAQLQQISPNPSIAMATLIDAGLRHLGLRDQRQTPQGGTQSQNSLIGSPDQAGLTELFGNQMVAGFGDTIGAAGGAAIESAVGGLDPNAQGDFGDRFDRTFRQIRQNQNQRADTARERDPTLSGAAEIAGGFSGAALPVGAGLSLSAKAAKAGSGIVGKSLASATDGIIAGGLFGAGNADETQGAGEVLSEAADGATLGAALGLATPVASISAGKVLDGLKKLAAPVQGRLDAGTERVRRALEEAGITVQEALERIRGGEVIGQQDSLLMDLTRAISRQPGAQRKTIDDALEDGFRESQKAFTKQTARALHAEDNFYRWLGKHKEARGKQAKSAYEFAYRKNNVLPPEAATEITGLLQRVPGDARREAQRVAKIQGRPFGENLFAAVDESGELAITRVPSLREAEQIRRSLKSAATESYKAGKGEAGNAFRELEQQFRAVIDGASPALKNVRAKYADSMAIEEAAELGLDLHRMPADKIEYLLEGLTPSEIEAARKGFASAMKDKIERGQVNRDALKAEFGSTRMRRALGALFPERFGFDQFADEMQKRADFHHLRGRVQGNSKSQQDLSDAESLIDGSLGRAVFNVGTGNFGLAAREMALKFFARNKIFSRGLPGQTLQRMADLMVERNPERAARLLGMAQSGNKTAIKLLKNEMRRVRDIIKAGEGSAAAVAGAGSGPLQGQLPTEFQDRIINF